MKLSADQIVNILAFHSLSFKIKKKHRSSVQNVNMFCVLKANTGTEKEKNGALLFEVQNTKQA